MMQPGVTLIGPVSQDIIRIAGTPERTQPGGAVFYAGMALRALDVPVHIITRLAPQDEAALLCPLREAGAAIYALPSAHTTSFINSYAPDTDERNQQVTGMADPILLTGLPPVTTQWVYLAPLLENDIPAALIRHLAGSGAHRVALDAQGLLRRATDGKVFPISRPDLLEILPHINIVKVDAQEAELITGQRDPEMAARILCGRGADHALVTLGARGAILCHRGALIRQPAWRPADGNMVTVDTTGCGDTFLAAYLSRILLGETMPTAGHFAAIAAALKLRTFGPLRADVREVQRMAEKP